VALPPAVEGGEAKRVETRPPLRADVSPGDDGARVTVRIYHGKGRGAGPRPSPAASLFDSAVGSRSLVVRLYPNTFAVRLDWQDGELVGVRIDGAFPDQPDAAPTRSRRVFRVRHTEKALVLEQEPESIPARMELLGSGAPTLVEVDRSGPIGKGESSVDQTLSFDWRDGELAGVRVQGEFHGQIDPDGTMVRRVFRVKHRQNDVALALETPEIQSALAHAMRENTGGLDRLREETVGALREEILNAASGIVAAAWQARPAPKRVDAALPLVLIAQIQRSGGTLLSQLFDGHPEVWAFPQELKWGGKGTKHCWPSVDPGKDGPLRVARGLVAANLDDAKTYNLFGYQKEGTSDRDQRLPFHWSQWAYVQAFLDAWEARQPQTRRQCFDIFMSAYFSAFLDWRTGAESKKIITAFTPRVNFTNSYPENAAFFHDYPDGRMISMCRHPVDWYASASRHESKYVDVDQAMAQWRESAESSMQLKEHHPDHVILVSFTALVSDPDNAMKSIARRLGLTWHPTLAVPTFNGMPIASNSSFDSVVGIDPSAATRRDRVEADLRERIEAENLALYQRFIEAADVKAC
jgi:hypothetical protein